MLPDRFRGTTRSFPATHSSTASRLPTFSISLLAFQRTLQQICVPKHRITTLFERLQTLFWLPQPSGTTNDVLSTKTLTSMKTLIIPIGMPAVLTPAVAVTTSDVFTR